MICFLLQAMARDEMVAHFGSAYCGNLRSADEVISEAMLRLVSGGVADALLCAFCALQIHRLPGRSLPELRFSAYSEQEADDLYWNCFRAAGGTMDRATQEAHERVSRALSDKAGNFVITPLSVPRLSVFGGGRLDPSSAALAAWEGAVSLERVLPAFFARGASSANNQIRQLPKLVMVQASDCSEGVALELLSARRSATGECVVEVVFAAAQHGALDEAGPFSVEGEATRALMQAAQRRKQWPPTLVLSAEPAAVRALAAKLRSNQRLLSTQCCARLRSLFSAADPPDLTTKAGVGICCVRDGVLPSFLGTLIQGKGEGGAGTTGPAVSEFAAGCARSAARRKAQGNASFQQRDYAKASKHWREALSLLDEEDSSGVEIAELRATLYSNVAEAQLQLRKWPAAAEAASRALEIDAGHRKARLRRCKARQALGDVRGALADIEELKRIAPLDKTLQAALLPIVERLRSCELFTLEAPSAQYPSIQAALDTAAQLPNGASVRVKAGRHKERLEVGSSTSGPIVLVGDRTAGPPTMTSVASVTVRGARCRLEHLDVTGGVSLCKGAARCELRACVVSNEGGTGIENDASGPCLVDKCVVEHCQDGIINQRGELHVRDSTIQLCDCDGIFSNTHVIVQDTRIENVARHGIKSRGGVTRRGDNDIQPSEWDDHPGY